MSVIGYLHSGRIVDVTSGTPLPVQQQGAVALRPADTLLVANVTVDTTARDLLNTTTTELPTLDGCGQYRKLVWLARRASDTQINYTIRARATDPVSGAPLDAGWRTIATGNFPTDAANPNWLRLDIPATGDGYWDQYRIEVSVASGTVSLISKIVGVR